MKAPRILFITGTDTGVGKTVLSVLWVRFLRRQAADVLAVKPIASGGREDARALYAAQEGHVPLDRINPWYFRAALAPPLAARHQGQRLRFAPVLKQLQACQTSGQLLIVEGAGGLLSPLGEHFDSRDLIFALRATPIVVAPNRLGAVHQVRVTLSALPKTIRRRALVVLSEPPRPGAAERHNAALLQEFEPEVRLLTLPWLPRWRERVVDGSDRLQRTLSRLSQLAGIGMGKREPRR